MKTLNYCLLLGTMTVLGAGVPARAQPTLSLQTFAGLNVTGTTGSIYTIQYRGDLSQSNSWSSLVFLQLPASNYLWVDTSAPVAARRFYRAALQDPPTNMVFIPPDVFKLGSPTNEEFRSSDEGPQTVVTVSHGFWMGKYLVTQGEYSSLMGANPSTFTGDLSRPVESVSWLNASNYCVMLTQRELAAGRIPAGSHFRLPTEAEWEYAARAWTSTRYSYGDDPGATSLTNYAWFASNAGLMTHPVGQKLPNPWGLYDMIGNVWEWCQDWYGPYPGGFETDPLGPAASTGTGLGSYKVIRGGAYDYPDSSCRSASRLIFAPVLEDSDVGFRVVLATGQP